MRQRTRDKSSGVVVGLRSRRAIYLLPNLFTTAGMFAGFFAIIKATQGQFDWAAGAVFFAMVMDALDGRIARWTNTTSEFGLQYDSLSDLIAFGLAPALVMYEWGLVHLGKAGWLAAFFYVAMAAARLARFNTREGQDKRYFQGLPSPAAAALIVSAVWVLQTAGLETRAFQVVAALLTVAVGTVMFSNVTYRSFKDVQFKGMRALIVLVWAIVLLVWEPRLLFLVFFVYFVSGPVLWLWRWRQKNNEEGPKIQNTGS